MPPYPSYITETTSARAIDHSRMDRAGHLVTPTEQANWARIVGNELCGKIRLRERQFQEDISKKSQEEETILKETKELIEKTNIMKKELVMTENLLKMKLELITRWEQQVQNLKNSQNVQYRRTNPDSSPVATKQLVQHTVRQTSNQEGLVVQEEVRFLVQRKITFAQFGDRKPERRSKPVEQQESRKRSPLHRTERLFGSRFKSSLNQDKSRRDKQVQPEVPVSSGYQPKKPVLCSTSRAPSQQPVLRALNHLEVSQSGVTPQPNQRLPPRPSLPRQHLVASLPSPSHPHLPASSRPVPGSRLISSRTAYRKSPTSASCFPSTPSAAAPPSHTPSSRFVFRPTLSSTSTQLGATPATFQFVRKSRI